MDKSADAICEIRFWTNKKEGEYDYEILRGKKHVLLMVARVLQTKGFEFITFPSKKDDPEFALIEVM